MSNRTALIGRLARLEEALSAEQAHTANTERELAKLRQEMKHPAPATAVKPPPARRFLRGAISADLTGFGFKPVDIAIMADRGQLRRKCTDITVASEYTGHPNNKNTSKVYRPRLSCDITRQFEQYQCSKQSPALMDV